MLLLIIVSCDNNFGSFIKTFCKNNDELQRIYKELSHVHYTEIVIGMFQASCGKSSLKRLNFFFIQQTISFHVSFKRIIYIQLEKFKNEKKKMI